MTADNFSIVPTDGNIREREHTKTVWFLHGANASPSSFNYIKEHLEADEDFNDFDFVDISYNCQDNLPRLVEILCRSINPDTQLYLIGHSLGGVLAAAISQRALHFEMPVSIRGVITLSAPFGGSESSDYLKFLFPNYHLFKSTSTQNRMIVDLQSVGAKVPTLSLVTSSGNNPLFSTANDGVVTVSSQRALSGVKYVEVPFNHFEVLVSPDTVEHVKLFLRQK